MRVIPMQIHGNYCGANWTHGINVPAKDYFLYPEVTPIDRLDQACQAHDKDCSHGGCSSRGDTALRNAALVVAVSSSDVQTRAIATSIAIAMHLVKDTRDR